MFTQISFDDEAVIRWRDRTGFDGQVYAGVVVLASDKMAMRLRELIPGFEVPDALLADLARDGSTRQFCQTADALERASIE